MTVGFIVEGFHDETKVKQIIPDACIVVTKGTRMDNRIRRDINSALNKCERVYILTDPDSEGDLLANMILKDYPFLPRIRIDPQKCIGYKNHKWKIGVEHAGVNYLKSVLEEYIVKRRL